MGPRTRVNGRVTSQPKPSIDLDPDSSSGSDSDDPAGSDDEKPSSASPHIPSTRTTRTSRTSPARTLPLVHVSQRSVESLRAEINLSSATTTRPVTAPLSFPDSTFEAGTWKVKYHCWENAKGKHGIDADLSWKRVTPLPLAQEGALLSFWDATNQPPTILTSHVVRCSAAGFFPKEAKGEYLFQYAPVKDVALPKLLSITLSLVLDTSSQTSADDSEDEEKKVVDSEAEDSDPKEIHQLRCESCSPSDPTHNLLSHSADQRKLGTDEADANAAFLQDRHPNDTSLYFPHTSQRLWANSRILRARSPFFEQLLASVPPELLAIGAVSGEKSPQEDSSVPKKRPRLDLSLEDFDDSDLEDDTMVATPKETSPNKCEELVYNLTITDAAYKTYRAVLWWLYTGEINFSRFRSFHTPSSVDLGESKVDATDPLAASPKSVYHLGRSLQLEELATLALESIKTQLTSENVAKEAFGYLSQKFGEVQEMEIEFLAEHLDQVEDTEGYREIEALMDNEALPYGGSMMSKIRRASKKRKVA